MLDHRVFQRGHFRHSDLPLGNPAMYTGVFDLIRDLFAKTQAVKVRG